MLVMGILSFSRHSMGSSTECTARKVLVKGMQGHLVRYMLWKTLTNVWSRKNESGRM